MPITNDDLKKATMPTHSELIDEMGANWLQHMKVWEKEYPESIRELRLAQTKMHEAMLWAREGLNPTLPK